MRDCLGASQGRWNARCRDVSAWRAQRGGEAFVSAGVYRGSVEGVDAGVFIALRRVPSVVGLLVTLSQRVGPRDGVGANHPRNGRCGGDGHQQPGGAVIGV